MRRLPRSILLIGVLGASLAPAPARAACTAQPEPARWAWQGESRAMPVEVPVRGESGTVECATIFAPADGTFPSPRPMIVTATGGGGAESAQHAKARALAGAGYVVLSVGPMGRDDAPVPACAPDPARSFPVRCPALDSGLSDGQVRGVVSGIDFLLSSSNPFADISDAQRLGAAGFSNGASAVTIAQETDDRIDAIVAWDNLRSTRWGDDGTATCTSPHAVMRLVADIEVTPRVPALGTASEGTCNRDNPDAKKSAYAKWRAAGLPSGEIVFAGTSHTTFNSDNEEFQRRLAHYTIAWFDQYVLGDGDAGDRLLARDVAGTPRDGFLSVHFRSAMFMPARSIDCEDLPTCTG